MQITAKEQTGLSYSFNIVVPKADIEAETTAALEMIGKKAKIQGFRPGKVPANVLKQRYGKEVLGDVLETSVNKATKKLMDEKKLHPAFQPDIKVVSFEEGADLSFDISFEVMPEMPAIDFDKVTVD